MMKYTLVLTFLLMSFIDAFSQCEPDRHTTEGFDGWVSCSVKPNPNANANRGDTHWLRFDFGSQKRFIGCTFGI